MAARDTAACAASAVTMETASSFSDGKQLS